MQIQDVGHNPVAVYNVFLQEGFSFLYLRVLPEMQTNMRLPYAW